MWTRFMDMHSGGSQKEQWPFIYIEAGYEEAVEIFKQRFGHDPHNITCSCCGDDYSVSEDESLEQLTAYDRNCQYDRNAKKWIESGGQHEYIKLKHYLKNKDCLFLDKSMLLLHKAGKGDSQNDMV